MKIIAALMPVLLVFMSCSRQPAEPEQKEAPTMHEQAEHQLHIPKQQLASDLDQVCGMSVAEGQADTMQYKGKVYGFCGKGCKESFAVNPASFLK